MTKVEQLFAAGRAVLKQTPSQEEAKRIVMQLAASGAIATIEPSGSTAAKKPTARPTRNSPTRATPSPFTPLRHRLFLKPLLWLGAAREVLFNLLHLILILTIVVVMSLSGGWIEQVIPSPLAVQLLQGVILLFTLLLLLLLIKPLLALVTIEQAGIPLTAEQEPDLYVYVEDLCERIGAPPPAEIHLQEVAEVQVAYHRGPQGWLENRTVLTLGVPLIAGLNFSQLSALLACRFSRFRTNCAPRAAAVVLHGHGWLQRAAGGEDLIDRTLTQWHQKGLVGDGLFKGIQSLLAPSRRLMAWRLRLSRALDRRALQRLVAEGDALALAFSGKEGFIRLLDQTRMLDFVGGKLLHGLNEQWQNKGVLPGNLVQMMVLRSRQYPVTTPQKLRLIQERQKAALGDILPSDRQRLQRIDTMATEPGTHCLSPASALFRHYHKLTRSMTLRYYHHRLGLPVSPYRLQQVFGKKSLEYLQQQKLDQYFHGLYVDFIPLKLHQRIRKITSFAEVSQQWNIGMTRSQSEYEKAKSTITYFDKAEAALVNATTREEIHLAGLWRKWGEEKLKNDELDEVHQDARDSERDHQHAVHGLEQYLKAYSIRLAAILATLNQREGMTLPNAQSLKQEVQMLVSTLEMIENVHTQLRELKLQTLLLETLLSQRTPGRNSKLDDRIDQLAADVQHLTRAIGFALKNAPYPFADRKAKQLMKYVLQNALMEDTPQGDFDRGKDTVDTLAQVQRRALVRLIVIAGQLEKTLGS